MNSGQHQTSFLRVHVSDRNLAKPALRDLGRGRELSVDVLRGRITGDDAFLTLHVTGRAQRIKEFLRQGDTGGASLAASSRGVA